MIEPGLKNNGNITLDFNGINSATQSYGILEDMTALIDLFIPTSPHQLLLPFGGMTKPVTMHF
jgi:hypothetical protein